MTKIVWRHFSLQIPDAWEMLLFSRDMQAGYCTFADRYQHRLEFNWKQIPGNPDWERMWQDYRDQLACKSNHNSAPLPLQSYKEWVGLDIQAEKAANSRYGRWFSGEHCLIEMVFLWPGRRDEQLLKQVLDSVAEVPADRHARRLWCAFGMQVLASDELALRVCVAQPGQVQMVFTHIKDALREERFERMGLVSYWLRETHRPMWPSMR